MRTRIRQAALRMAMLRKEYSSDELAEAVRFLEECGIEDRLTAFLLNGKLAVGGGKRQTSGMEPETPPLPSEGLLRIKDKEPEKFTLLADFEESLWRNEVLTTLAQIRHAGQSLSKSFEPGRSRKQGINALMVELLKLPLDRIKQVMQSAIRQSEKTPNGFRELARFIIHGSREPEDAGLGEGVPVPPDKRHPSSGS